MLHIIVVVCTLYTVKHTNVYWTISPVKCIMKTSYLHIKHTISFYITLFYKYVHKRFVD